MGKKLKIGLVFMITAVVMTPLAMLFKNGHQNLPVLVLISSMVLELIGLLFVVMHILEKRRN